MAKKKMTKTKTKKKNVFAGVGISKSKNAFTAGKEAVGMAIEKMKKQGGKRPDFGFVFCSENFDVNKLVKSAHEAFVSTNPKIKWIGCTTPGQISNYGITEDACIAMAVSSDYLHLGIGIAKNAFKNPKSSGKSAVNEALEDVKIDRYVDAYLRFLAVKKLPVKELVKIRPYNVILIVPGFTLNKPSIGDEVVRGVQEVITSNVGIVGGASTSEVLQENYQFYNGDVLEDSVVCGILASGTQTFNTLAHGFEPTQKVALVTKSQDFDIVELGGKPAADHYAQLCGKSFDEVWPAFLRLPGIKHLSEALIRHSKKLGVDMREIPFLKMVYTNPFGAKDIKGNFWLKVPFSIRERSLVLSEKIPVNTNLHIMKATTQNVIKAFNSSVESCEEELGEVGFLMIFSCLLRKYMLGGKIFKVSKELLKLKYPVIGFYGGGEIGTSGPYAASHHILTVSVFGVGDKLIGGNKREQIR